MAKVRDILFKHKFKYKEDQSQYSFQLKKRRNWWWLLLLLLPLLLLLKCECEPKEADDDEEEEEVEIVQTVDHADIVMCIDNTYSMKNFLDMVKKNAINFHADLKKYCARNGQQLNEVRMRVIAFGDFGDSPIMDSGLLEIPKQKKQFQAFVNDISLTDGGDGPEDAYEALAMAIDTDWDMSDARRRHIIVMYTDAAPHEVGFSATKSFYPDGMPADMKALKRMWNGMDRDARRLVLFAPDCEGWNRLKTEWGSDVYHKTKDLNTVLSGDGYTDILEAISKSL